MSKCLRCGHELVKVSDENRIYPDENTIEYACQYCGTYITVREISEDEKDTVPKYNKELEKDFVDESHGYYGVCPECGKHIVWSSDFMRSEVWGDVEKDEEDSLVSYVYCPYCGSMIEIVEPNETELKRFPIYKELNK